MASVCAAPKRTSKYHAAAWGSPMCVFTGDVLCVLRWQLQRIASDPDQKSACATLAPTHDHVARSMEEVLPTMQRPTHTARASAVSGLSRSPSLRR